MSNGSEPAEASISARPTRSPGSGTRTLFLRRLRRRFHVFAHRSVRRVLGWTLVVAGAILTPTPVPIGLPLVAIGFYLVARDSVMARGMVRWVRRHIPPLHRGLEGLHPRVGKGMRAFIDRTHPDRDD